MITLETNRLILKPQTIDNVEKIYKWRNDPTISYFCNDWPDDCYPIPLSSIKEYKSCKTSNRGRFYE